MEYKKDKNSRQVYTPKIAQDITDMVIARLGKSKVISILLYGSAQISKEFWDLDILLILKEKISTLNDLSELKDIISKFYGNEIDFQVLYENEISSANTFSLDAHGAFFSYVLSSATTLYGSNPFEQFSPKEEIVIISLLNRIQRYIYQVRQEYLGIGRYVRDKNPQYHRKHLRRLVLDLMLMFEPTLDIDQAILMFKQLFPLASKKQEILFATHSDDVKDYIEAYEEVYSIALTVVEKLIPRNEKRLERIMVDEMVVECALPTSSNGRAIIIVDGLPRVPELRSFMNLLAAWGFAVFFPRLKGTWESKGNFLDHDPSDDIRVLSQKLRNGILLGSQKQKLSYDQITVMGTSFGGLVAFASSISNDIAQIIALSPVYTMSEVHGVETLNIFLKETYPGAYRFSDENWDRLITNSIISFASTLSNTSFNPAKCTIIAGEQDIQVNTSRLRELCKEAHIPIHVLSKGHLSFHKDITAVRFLLYKLLCE